MIGIGAPAVTSHLMRALEMNSVGGHMRWAQPTLPELGYLMPGNCLDNVGWAVPTGYAEKKASVSILINSCPEI